MLDLFDITNNYEVSAISHCIITKARILFIYHEVSGYMEKSMMYRNLKAELVRDGITYERAGAALDMSSNNFGLKVAGKVPFTINEIKKIRTRFFPTISLDYLCETDGDEPSIYDQLANQVDVMREAFEQEGTLSPECEQTLNEIAEKVEQMRQR